MSTETDLPPEIKEVIETADGDDAELTVDDIFEILKNERRRRVLVHLRANDGEADIGELAEVIAAKENDIDVSQLSSDQRKRVYISLYQGHLPKMDSKGVIEFQKNRGTVELQPAAEQLFSYLSLDSESEETEKYYLLRAGFLAVVAAGIIVGYALNVLALYLVWISIAAMLIVSAVELLTEFYGPGD